MNDFEGLYHIRAGKPEDINFIYSTFLRGLYYGNSWFNVIPKDIFFPNYQKVITALLTRSTTIVQVACLPDEEDAIIGFSISSIDTQTLHWVSVKKDWRQHGIAKTLIPFPIKQVTHLTKLGLELLPKLKDCIFNPFII